MTDNSPGRAEMLFLLHSQDTVIIECESINRPFDNEDIIIFMQYGEGLQFDIVYKELTFADYLITEGTTNKNQKLINKIISFENYLSDEQILKLMTYLYSEKANDMINSAKLLNISPFEIKPNNIDILNNISIDF